MTTPLHIIATLMAKPSHADALRQLLEPAVPKFRAEPGCQGYVLLEDLKHPGRFVTYETWIDEAALQAHMHSPTMQALAPQMGELLVGPLRQEFLSVVVAT